MKFDLLSLIPYAQAINLLQIQSFKIKESVLPAISNKQQDIPILKKLITSLPVMLEYISKTFQDH